MKKLLFILAFCPFALLKAQKGLEEILSKGYNDIPYFDKKIKRLNDNPIIVDSIKLELLVNFMAHCKKNPNCNSLLDKSIIDYDSLKVIKYMFSDTLLYKSNYKINISYVFIPIKKVSFSYLKKFEYYNSSLENSILMFWNSGFLLNIYPSLIIPIHKPLSLMLQRKILHQIKLLIEFIFKDSFFLYHYKNLGERFLPTRNIFVN